MTATAEAGTLGAVPSIGDMIRAFTTQAGRR